MPEIKSMTATMSDTGETHGMKWSKIFFDANNDGVGEWMRPSTPALYDEDGVISIGGAGFSAPNGLSLVVDTSQLISRVTGRQCSQHANYRVTGIGVKLLNVNDSNDNNRAHFTQGKIKWMSPNSYVIDSVKAFREIRREVEKLSLSTQEGTSTIFAKYFPNRNPNIPYKDMRFGLYRGDDVQFPSDMDALLTIHKDNDSEETQIENAGGLSLTTMLDITEAARIGTGQGADFNNPPNKLWHDRDGVFNTMSFSCGLDNASNSENLDVTDNRAETFDYFYQAPAGSYLNVCTGLMAIEFTHSNSVPNVEEILSAADNHHVEVTLQVEGWTKW